MQVRILRRRFLVAQAIRSSLDDANLVVESFDEAQRDFVLRSAIGGDAIPMTLDHLGKFLVRLQPLPSQAGTPLIEEASGPFALVAPELSEGLFSAGRRCSAACWPPAVS